jgi:pimeloyl-ACP methyl ester carboxylesterase
VTRIEFKGHAGASLVADRVGTGRPVILLHGAGQTRGSWYRTAQALADRGKQAITLDARGHGESDWAAGDYDFEVFIGDLRAVIDTLDEAPALIGASLGGLTAMLAIGEADRPIASALVLVDIATRINRRGAAAMGEFMRANPNGFESIEAAADAVSHYLPHRPRPSNITGLRRNLRERPDGRFYWHWDPKLFANAGTDPGVITERLEAAARKVAVPTMLVRGGRSEMVDGAALERFREILPDASIVEVADAGHMVAGDSNTLFAAAVLTFLDRVFPAKPKED